MVSRKRIIIITFRNCYGQINTEEINHQFNLTSVRNHADDKCDRWKSVISGWCYFLSKYYNEIEINENYQFITCSSGSSYSTTRIISPTSNESSSTSS